MGGLQLFEVLERAIAFAFHQFVPLRQIEVVLHHFLYHFRKGDLWYPAQFLACVGWIAKQAFHLGGAEVPVIKAAFAWDMRKSLGDRVD